MHVRPKARLPHQIEAYHLERFREIYQDRSCLLAIRVGRLVVEGSAPDGILRRPPSSCPVVWPLDRKPPRKHDWLSDAFPHSDNRREEIDWASAAVGFWQLRNEDRHDLVGPDSDDLDAPTNWP